MVKPLDTDARWMIIYQTVVLGRSKTEIANDLSISRKTIGNIRHLFYSTGDILPLPHGGEPISIISEEDAEFFNFISFYQPNFFLSEFQLLISFFLNIPPPSISTISRVFLHLGYSRKQLHLISAQRDPNKRADYSIRISEYSTNQLVFLDESGRNSGTLQCRYGWSPLGRRAEMKVDRKARDGKNNSIIFSSIEVI